MARDEIEITLTESEGEKLKSLEEAVPVSSPLNKPLIQMAPQILRSCYGKEDWERYFKPTSVAIGPLHHRRENGKDSRMERGEQCKLKLAAMFIERCKGTGEDFYKNVKREIHTLKYCYNFEEVQKWSDEELAWMFLVDGCALLQFIVLDVKDAWEEFSVDNDLVSIEKVDFFLLENQLPYQLLEILIDSFDRAFSVHFPDIYPSESPKQSIAEFINRTFLILTAQQRHQIQIDFPQPYPGYHLLDMLRRKLMGEKDEKAKEINNNGLLEKLTGDKSKHGPLKSNVRELKDKGIRFKAKEKEGAITDIDFKNRYRMATLTLAPIFLHNTTVPLLLNLIAYELCPDFKEKWEITSYFSFLNSLIDNAEDVKELRVAGVLYNGLGSDEAVAELLSKTSGILVAVALEKTALSDEYFIKRKLYPNVDFYSGLMHRAMGCPPEYFTVLFALPRMAGYLAHWRESLDDPDTKIMRPKQDFLILRFAFEISGIYWGMAEALYATERGDGVTRCRQVR
ncbi:hypothetical protein SLEP1_g56365 [Rubroshorea leprosula]|uniref:Citrate synthase n=1 Tax=Rubroshorea leprosula TaxID=152421 RepID=A0AAV5MJE0_9ROSI|nr:hypothetical protein SLEP1_g56365 [Rubroshorea leprosula]